jgi:hypothetical protein
MEEYKQKYQPTKIIVLSELTVKEKELFYQMMILNKCKFNRIDNNKYITNIRLLAPFIKKYNYNNNNEYQNDNNTYNNKKDSNNYSLSFQERLTKLKYDGFITITIIDPTTNSYNQHDNSIHECSTHYPRFISLIANDNDIVYPKFRPFTW